MMELKLSFEVSPTFNDSPTKRGKWVVEDDINNDMLILSPESVDNTSTTSINIFNKDRGPMWPHFYFIGK